MVGETEQRRCGIHGGAWSTNGMSEEVEPRRFQHENEKSKITKFLIRLADVCGVYSSEKKKY